MPIPFNKIRFANLEEILKILNEALSQLGIDFYLIGAIARDIQLSGKHNIVAPRATRDIDIAILVHDQDSYDQLVRNLQVKFGFTDTDQPYRYKYKDGTLVDILPFGQIESEERTVTLQGRKVEKLSVIGFQENHRYTEEVEFDDGFKVNVSSLAGICVLKFFAWGDKPNIRERDIGDINFILSKYNDIHIDEIFDKQSDILGLDWDSRIPARLLGRHMAIILNEDHETKETLLALLNDNITQTGRLPELFTRLNKRTIEENISIIKQIITGVNE